MTGRRISPAAEDWNHRRAPPLVTAAPDDEPTLKGDVTHLLGAR